MKNYEKIPLYMQEYDCLYYKDGRSTTNIIVYPDKELMKNYDFFLMNGFRRFGNEFYKSMCKDCHECIPIRIKLSDFKLSKSQKKNININKNIKIDILSNSFINEKKINLYNKYKKGKHNNNDFSNSIETLENLHYNFDHIIEINYFYYEKLIGVGILDESENSFSSNYFYYDPDFMNQRLGEYSILKEIEYSKLKNKKYYYLGYYLKDFNNMNYKKNYRPNEIFKNGLWTPFNTSK